MVQTLVLNKKCITNNKNSEYTYTFNNTVHFKKGSKIALKKLSIYYSWPNITSSYNNMSFSYMWFDISGNLTVKHQILFESGYYGVDDMNDYMIGILASRGHYLLFPNQANVRGHSNGVAYSSTTKYYFLKITDNATYYSCQLRFYALPIFMSASPTYTQVLVTGYNWKVPSATVSGANTTYKVPKIVFDQNQFTNILGFTVGTYGIDVVNNSAGYTDVLSNQLPQVSPVNSVLVLCSLINNVYGAPNTLMSSFSNNETSYGGLINVEDNQLDYIDIREGAYNSFKITLLDQDFNIMNILDDNNVILMSLSIPEDDVTTQNKTSK